MDLSDEIADAERVFVGKNLNADFFALENTKQDKQLFLDAGAGALEEFGAHGEQSRCCDALHRFDDFLVVFLALRFVPKRGIRAQTMREITRGDNRDTLA